MAHNYAAYEGAVMDYLNTKRGQALQVVFQALRARGDVEGQWEWVEKMAAQHVAALRVGAVANLLSLTNRDSLERSWRAFAALCDGNPDVLRCGYAHRFLHWFIYQDLARSLPLARELMNDQSEGMAQEGAQIACKGALRSSAVDASLLRELLDGPVTWRRGVAQIAAGSVTRVLSPEILTECARLLETSFFDDDDKVRSAAARFTIELREEHIESLAPLVEAFVRSPAYKDGDHWLHEWMLQSGDLRPDWTLVQIQTVLSRAMEGESVLHGLGGDELARCVLRLYTLPDREQDVPFRAHCMDVFGELLEQSQLDAQKALKEWDEGRFY